MNWLGVALVASLLINVLLVRVNHQLVKWVQEAEQRAKIARAGVDSQDDPA